MAGKAVAGEVERNSVTVTILGQRMVLRSREEAAHIERLASFVNRKIDEVSAGTAAGSTKLAVLAAMNIANDYFQLLGEERDFKAAVAERSRTMLAELDSLVGDPGYHDALRKCRAALGDGADLVSALAAEDTEQDSKVTRLVQRPASKQRTVAKRGGRTPAAQELAAQATTSCGRKHH